jgi:hypothetical protein
METGDGPLFRTCADKARGVLGAPCRFRCLGFLYCCVAGPRCEKLRLAFGRNHSYVIDDALYQRAEHRDTQAIHAKLDELLRVEGRARSELIELDNQEPEAIEQHRSNERQ